MTVKEYFNGDELAADVFMSKYAIKEQDEKTPEDMHWRLAKELARSEVKYHSDESYTKSAKDLSEFGQGLFFNEQFDEEFIFGYLDKFRYIVPQGSIMSMLGNKQKIGSLSNCFVIPSPIDSYGGIMKT